MGVTEAGGVYLLKGRGFEAITGDGEEERRWSWVSWSAEYNIGH